MILPSFNDLRSRFSVHVVNAVSLSFVDTNPDTLVRVLGDFVADGYEIGMRLQVTASVSNNHTFTIAGVTPLVLTLAATDAVVVEGPVVPVLDGYFQDPDGYETWPVAKVREPGSGFGDLGSTLSGIPTPLATFSGFTVSCNSGAADAIAGVDEYDWYLSARTAVAGALPLGTQDVVVAPNTYSGSVEVTPVSANFGKAPGAPMSPEDVVKVFKNCHLYVKRISDGAIQWVDLLRAQVASTP